MIYGIYLLSVILLFAHYISFLIELANNDIESKLEFWVRLICPPVWWVMWIMNRYHEI